VDGIFGPKTESAVRDLQQNENLSVDGIVGKQTWTALLRRWLLFSQPG
jgi:peptidoglycan hydrolase-like protein with peptidoglycan-binding domain